MAPSRTHAIVNASVTPTAEFVSNPNWKLPGTDLLGDIAEACGPANVAFVLRGATLLSARPVSMGTSVRVTIEPAGLGPLRSVGVVQMVRMLDDGRFAGPPDGQVADRDHGTADRARLQHPASVEPLPRAEKPAVAAARRRQEAPRPASEALLPAAREP